MQPTSFTLPPLLTFSSVSKLPLHNGEPLASNTDRGFVIDKTAQRAIVYTDDHRAYVGLPYAHKTVKHSVREYAHRQAHTNGIESFWALLKRGYMGTFHQMSAKHLDRYVSEFEGRHSSRPMDTEDQISSYGRGSHWQATFLRRPDRPEGNPTIEDTLMPFGNELFTSPFRERIIKVLPTLFNMVELENKRGKKLGMEVGTARERVLIALFMYIYGPDKIEFPPSTSPELDVWVDGHPVSIKTKSGSGLSGVKLVWTVDWDAIDAFLAAYHPASDLLYVNINWGKTGGFTLIPQHVQEQIIRDIGIHRYVKVPPRGTNPRGVEFSREALGLLLNHQDAQSLPIAWRRDPSLLVERHLYGRWIDLWDSL